MYDLENVITFQRLCLKERLRHFRRNPRARRPYLFFRELNRYSWPAVPLVCCGKMETGYEYIIR